ncbi:hypothetical protein SLEP1_g51275 [Rubroshorea leprosula]|uniref:Uncharacterized protein n=1 Tax=Rubroshorea leprosula TaxID=152421 RepID=A0AAV5M2M7_9ROSI|nr:hypothetical protein SLEP1_g51275 [Rubroshorea leprosula]
MTSIKLKLVTFDGTVDFGLWRVKAKSLLVHQGASYALTREYPKYYGEREKVKVKDKAFSTLQLIISDEVLCGVVKETTTKDLWEALERKYMGKSLYNKLYCKQRLYLLRMQEGTSITSHINAFTKEALKTNELKAKNEASTSENKDEGLVVRGRTLEKGNCHSKSRSKSRGKSKTNVCYGCGEKGHIKMNCPNGREWFATYNEVKCVDVLMGDGHPCKVNGIGMVLVKMHDGVVRELAEVRHVLETKLYVLQGSTVTGSTNVVSSLSNKDLTKLWHMRLGVHQSKEPLDCIHSNLWGLSKNMFVGRAFYMLTFIDDHSRKVWVYFPKHKSEVFRTFKQWKVLVENHKGKKINFLRTDNGLEFCNQEFNEYCKNEGIARHRTVPETPLQNGMVECTNRTIMERVRCAGIEKGSKSKVKFQLDLESQKVSSSSHPPPAQCGVEGHDDDIVDHKQREEEEEISPDEPYSIAKHRLREIRKPQRYANVASEYLSAYALVIAQATDCDGEPSTYKETVSFAMHDLELEQLDVKTEFLHGELEESIYMEQPEGSMYDQCVYLRELDDGTFIYLLLYVDDMLISAKRKEDIDKLKKKLNNEFEMKDLGPTKRILGMEIRRDRHGGTIKLSQKQFVVKLCPRSNEDFEYMSRVPYSNAVGSMMYAIVCTRLDISHAISVVSRYMSNLGKEHWTAVKWVLRYLKGTTTTCLEFKRDGTYVQAYVDSDYVGDVDRRRSLIGYVFTLSGSAIH